MNVANQHLACHEQSSGNGNFTSTAEVGDTLRPVNNLLLQVNRMRKYQRNKSAPSPSNDGTPAVTPTMSPRDAQNLRSPRQLLSPPSPSASSGRRSRGTSPTSPPSLSNTNAALSLTANLKSPSQKSRRACHNSTEFRINSDISPASNCSSQTSVTSTTTSSRVAQSLPNPSFAGESFSQKLSLPQCPVTPHNHTAKGPPAKLHFPNSPHESAHSAESLPKKTLEPNIAPAKKQVKGFQAQLTEEVLDQATGRQNGDGRSSCESFHGPPDVQVHHMMKAAARTVRLCVAPRPLYSKSADFATAKSSKTCSNKTDDQQGLCDDKETGEKISGRRKYETYRSTSFKLNSSQPKKPPTRALNRTKSLKNHSEQEKGQTSCTPLITVKSGESSEEDSCEELETLSATGNLLLPDGEEETTGPDGVSSEYKQNDEDSPILHGQEFDLNLNDGLLNEEVKTYEAFSCGTSTFFEESTKTESGSHAAEIRGGDERQVAHSAEMNVSEVYTDSDPKMSCQSCESGDQSIEESCKIRQKKPSAVMPLI